MGKLFYLQDYTFCFKKALRNHKYIHIYNPSNSTLSKNKAFLDITTPLLSTLSPLLSLLLPAFVENYFIIYLLFLPEL